MSWSDYWGALMSSPRPPLKPTRYTLPLSEDYPSLWDRYEKAIQFIWRTAFGFELEPWQARLLRAILEVYPPGHERAGELRYRQVIVSIPRQQGKTEIAAVLGLIGLLREKSPLVIGIASSAEQARLVYKRTLHAIASNPALASKFKRLTDTRGIQSKTGGLYEMKAAKGAALQGLPVSTGVVDEVHLLKSELWQALINGMGARPNTIVVGITTAGGLGESELLLELYKSGELAIAGDQKLERFGFFCWEAPEARVPKDDGELLEFLKAANPALASGRLDPAIILSDIRAMPDNDVIRYRLNRFVESLSAFIPLSTWGKCQRDWSTPFPRGGSHRPVFAIDRSRDSGYATITVAVKDGDITHTEIVASLVNPTLDQLIDICVRLNKWHPETFVVDSLRLKQLGEELKKRRLPVRMFTGSETFAASSMFYAKTVQHKISHGGEDLLSVQIPRTIRKNMGDQWKLSWQDSSVEIDAVTSTLQAIYVAETPAPSGIKLH